MGRAKLTPQLLSLSSTLLTMLVCLFVFLLTSCSREAASQSQAQTIGPRSSARSGWSSSGGGDLFRDEHNPWFLENTKEVRYCILREASGFTATEEKTSELIRRALDYWVSEFRFQNQANNWKGFADVATQSFVKMASCDGSEDIRFHLGYSTLDQEQIEYLKSGDTPIADVIATTVRTSYDREQLKGRGFIYIASDHGASSYDTDQRLLAQAWRFDELLYRVIAHELGHVFGIPHVGGGLMRSRAVQDFVNGHYYTDYIEMKFDLGPFFDSVLHPTRDCKRSLEQRAFFGAGVEQKCLYLEPTQNEDELVVFASHADGSQKTLLGRIIKESHKDPEKKMNAAIAGSDGVEVWLPPEQKVFAKDAVRTSIKRDNLMQAAGFLTLSEHKRFQPAGSTDSKPLFIRWEPSQQQILGVHGDVMRIIYQYNSGNRTQGDI